MHVHRISHRSAVFGAAGAITVALLIPTAAALGAAPLSVGQAVAQQNGASATVRGYVVGQPTATNTVIRSNFPNDFALAIADSASETSTGRMLYVQITASYRSAWGLQTNPGLLGRQIDVTGPLTAYFAHPGLTSPTSFVLAGGTTPPPTTPPPGGGDSTYYRNAIGLSGAALKSALHQIISTSSRLTYAQVWDALKVTDQDPANSANVILIYSGRSQSKSTNGDGPNDWNREHVWAKSHGDFGTATGPGTDLHHLRPEDVSVNAARGNKDFDIGGSAVSEAPGSFTDTDSFEPRNAVKGDIARMIFYMAVRYDGGDGFADLEMNNSVNNGSAPAIGKRSVLLQWNTQDPPDTVERRRNQIIYDNYQHNRNPFIDHPEWANAIWN